MILDHQVSKTHVVISCGTNAPYPEWAKKSFFKHRDEHLNYSFRTWVDEYPKGSRSHDQSPYGFKVFAFNWALSEGYTHILWIDSAISFVSNPQPIFDFINNEGFFCVADSTGNLKRACRHDLFAYHNLTPDQTEDWHFMGGSVIGFNSHSPKLMEVFHEWSAQERDGYFHSASWPNHRWDETCLGLSLYKRGIAPIPLDISGHPFAKTNRIWTSYKL